MVCRLIEEGLLAFNYANAKSSLRTDRFGLQAICLVVWGILPCWLDPDARTLRKKTLARARYRFIFFFRSLNVINPMSSPTPPANPTTLSKTGTTTPVKILKS